MRNCVKELQHSEGCESQSQKKRGLTLDSPDTLEILNLATASLLIRSKERRCDCTALVKQKSSDNEFYYYFTRLLWTNFRGMVSPRGLPS